ncbi:response regulator [Methylorubrum extorquens]|jgi:two-component system, response regulator PdtaR|uniref:Response regulator receiver protein n=1 Tax=Methylorubrum extorquens DSM 13060 TaxID=882800 RepID=H1KRH0_METEX|nr:response regulator [Methylorubrum extorquens]EHP89877.1 response regulator receiver protein [Methylorubrum extorquens DSM 13060]
MPVALLVEDDPDIRWNARDILESAGFEVVEAADGDQGLACLAGDRPLDVLVTDCEMPGSLDGLGLLAAALRLRPGMPRIMVTGSMPEGPGCGAPILYKPYRADAVVEAVRSAMGAEPSEKSRAPAH